MRPQKSEIKNQKSRHRRGVLLLVVLSMLVLFLMIGTAFIITAKQSERASKAAQRGTLRLSTVASMGDLLDETIKQLVRDTNNPNSSLRFHSLLADLYGTEGFRARIANVDWATTPDRDGPSGAYIPPANPTGGQLLHFELVPGSLSDMYGQAIRFTPPSATGTPPPPLVEDAQFLSPLDNAYNGLVLTFLSGPCKDQSVRIVGYRPPNPSLPDGDPLRNALITVMCPESEYGGTLTDDEIGAMNASPSTILVNGRPFTGTGFGLSPELERLLARAPMARLSLHERLGAVDHPLALMPDYRFLNPEMLTLYAGAGLSPINSPKYLLSPVHLASIAPQALPTLAQRVGPAGIGGADESYDAADYQNMALALVPELQQNNLIETSLLDLTPATIALGTELRALLTDDDGNPMVIPSWHRPALINYWARNIAGASVDIRESPLAQETTGALLLRRIMMRPNWIDHERFTGSNPEYAAALTDGEKLARMVYGPWDVDNDNDGVRDSVWIDAGLPLMPGRHGKLVKPLVAMLVIDLDSKLNVNAHGTLDLVQQAINRQGQQVIPQVSDRAIVQLAGGRMSNVTPRGSGYGPADISLEAALGGGNFRWLLEGHDFGNGRRFPGRYGFGELVGANRVQRPGLVNYRDLKSQISLFGWPEYASQLTKFATPPDLRARYGAGINLLGQPILEATLKGEVDVPNGNLVVDSPYELNLSRSTVSGITGNEALAPANTPFSLAELERVLRVYDADAGTLPDRLAFLSGVLSPNGSIGDLTDRLKFSTDTFDLPAPSVGLTRQMLNYTSGNPLPSPLLSSTSVTGNPPQRRLPRSIAELMEIRIRARLNQAGVAAPLFPERITDAGAAQQLRGIMRQLLAPELADGTRLNINRPFGNGYDDDGDGAVDEQGELTVDGTPTKIWPNLAKRPETSAASTAFDGGGNPTAGAAFPEALEDLLLERQSQSPQYNNATMWPVEHRQLLARHLYVLALTLNAPADFRLSTNAERVKEDAELARRMAQWCVNAVDFRDADSKMTLFEYDVDPFDGWDVDGVVGFGSQDDDDSHRGLVIGAARPELVMTETLAWHDRRTDDTGSEEPFPADQQADMTKTDDPATSEDPFDYDQLVRPRGAFFLEVYNPWPSGAGASPELHANAFMNQAPNTPPEQRRFIDAGVNLSAVSEAWNPSTRQRSPVWRFAVYKRPRQLDIVNDADELEEFLELDPDHPDPEKRPSGQPDRVIYLTDFDPKHEGERGVHFMSNPNGVRVRPGRYLVIGSGEDDDGDGIYKTIIADREEMRNPDDPNRDRVRRIELNSNTAQGANGLRVNTGVPTVRMVDADDDVIPDITAANQPLNIQAPTEATLQGALNLQPSYPGDSSQYVTDVAIVDKATDPATKQPIERPLSLSIPFDGYPTKFRGSEWSETRQEYRSAEGGPLPIDIPLDGPIGGHDTELMEERYGPMEEWPSYLAEFNEQTRRWESRIDPVLTRIPKPGEVQWGASYAIIFLQRLADPQLVWNPEPGQTGHNDQLPVNPYVSVDRMTANLTVFNSRGDVNGEEEDGSPANSPRRLFASHERGYAAMLQQRAGGLPPTLWGTELPSVPRKRPGKDNPLPRPNDMFGGAQQNARMERELAESDKHKFDGVPLCSLGYLNRPFADPARQGEQSQLAPQQPFSWFAWNNRPYASSNELILVPRVRNSQLLAQFSTAETGGGGGPAQKPSSYTTEHMSEFEEEQPEADERPEFDHLENFFFDFAYEQTPPEPSPPEWKPPKASEARQIPGGMFALLDYIHVPSLFAGTETWLNPAPAYFGAARMTGAPEAVNDPLDPRWHRQPPFNSISTFREPGRVNINTLVGSQPPGVTEERSDVWAGLFHGITARAFTAAPPRPDEDTHPGPSFGDWTASRRGYGLRQGGSALTLDPLYPTLFTNPLRAPGSAEMVPPLVEQPSPDPYQVNEPRNGDPNRLVQSAVDVTLLRSAEEDSDTTRPKQYILSVSPPQTEEHAEPLFSATNPQIDLHQDAWRHPAFRYRPLTRLDNLVTGRSNVYAVWVTVGFFEVEPVKPWSQLTNDEMIPFGGNTGRGVYNKVYPDGYQLSKEDGIDLGDIKRLRGFYIIDRTLPAAFEPGVDHNVDNVIRLKRRIE